MDLKDKVFNALKAGVEVKTMKTLFKRYKHCFHGEKAVTFLVASGTVSSRGEGKRVMNDFLKEGRIACVSGYTVNFDDNKNNFYRFCAKIDREEAENIIAKLKSKVMLKKRTQLMSTYKNCFVGKECVLAMVVEGIAKDRSDASQIGNALLDMSPPYIEVVTGDNIFQDDNFFYRFCEVEKQIDSFKTTMRQSLQNSVTNAPQVQAPESNQPAFRELYSRIKKLGEGAFSVVVEAVHRSSEKSYAVKIVTRAKLSDEDERSLSDEISILNELKHDHIIQLHEVFDERRYVYLVLEMMCGGELFERIVAKTFYSEFDARNACKILFESIGYCHSNRVAHRDLKPENLLLVSQDDDSTLKIADFGFAKKAPDENCLTTQCGTPGYVAPEILEGVPYGTQSDMWSLGVIMYTLLGGYPPFVADAQKVLFRKIRKGSYEFHEQFWSGVSQEAKDLISKLLTVDPSKRLTAKEALQSSWIMKDDSSLSTSNLLLNQAELKKFNAKRKFVGAARAIMVINKMESLGDAFKLDLRDSINN